MLFENENYKFTITPDNIPNEGELFVDRSIDNRSSHLGHALVEYAPGKILDFFPNCSGAEEHLDGHTCYGWTEFKRSTDGGETWSDTMPYPYSKNLYDMQCGVVSHSEKAVTADDGTILVFNLLCQFSENAGKGWEPFYVPNFTKSTDGGETWSDAVRFCDDPGRVYDVKKKDGIIYVLIQVSKNPLYFVNEYRLYKSSDNGNTFTLASRLPFYAGVGDYSIYGALSFLPDGSLTAFTYRENDEFDLRYVTSTDGGETWSETKYSHFEKRIRNPQMIKFKNTYFCVGRSGSQGGDISNHNIIYCSKDGINWDSGRYLAKRKDGCYSAAYGNTLIFHDKNGKERLLIQMSYGYSKNRTNIVHWIIDYEEK